MIDHPGIGRYIRCLLPLIAEDSSVDLCLLGNREKIKKFMPFQAKVIDFDYPVYSLQEQIGFLKLKGIIGNDRDEKRNYILHVPHYNVPVLAGFNLVATIHDLIHIIYPQGASGKLAPVYMRFMMNRIVKTASGVICVSEATRNALEKLFCGEKGKIWDDKDKKGLEEKDEIRVIYEGVDKAFVKITDAAYLKSIKEKYELSDKFLLYVGSIRRHKNIKALLDAFDNFRRKNAGISLVMVGRRSQDIDIDREGVIYLGELASDRELAAIYNLASCLFNLSLYEGFGLTILEAQKCGLPVVCSDIPVHKEIGGEGIAAVRASYIDHICENMYNVLFNKGMREALILRGFKNTERFDWRKTARDTIEVYKFVGQV